MRTKGCDYIAPDKGWDICESRGRKTKGGKSLCKFFRKLYHKKLDRFFKKDIINIKQGLKDE